MNYLLMNEMFNFFPIGHTVDHLAVIAMEDQAVVEVVEVVNAVAVELNVTDMVAVVVEAVIAVSAAAEGAVAVVVEHDLQAAEVTTVAVQLVAI